MDGNHTIERKEEMPLFDTKTGVLSLKFYGDPKDTLQEDEVSVVYTTNHEANPQTMAADFWKYAGKVLYNLGNAPAAEMLRGILIDRISSGLKKNDDILHGNNYSLKKVAEKKGHVKTCEATFYKKSQPKTKFSWGGEEYYAPMSVLAFLQYIIDNLSECQLVQFSETLCGFLSLLASGDMPT